MPTGRAGPRPVLRRARDRLELPDCRLAHWPPSPEQKKPPDPTIERRAQVEARSGERPEGTNAWHAEFAVGYEISVRGDEGVWHGPRGGLLVRLATGPGLQALVQSALPQTREMDSVALEFYGGFLGLAGSYQHMLGQSVALEWVAEPGVEIVYYRPVRSLEPGVTAGRGDTEARPAVVAGVSSVFRRASPRISVGAQCGIPLLHTHYDVVVGDARRVIGRASPVVPSLDAKVRF